MTTPQGFRLGSRGYTTSAYGALLLWAVSATTWADETQVIRLSEPVESTETYETFGSPLPAVAEEASLVDVLDDSDRYADTDVQVTTKVKQVCQKKGCFFVAQAGGHVVRVSFKDYSFFVPTDISGKTVTLHGTLKRHELTQAQAEHFSKDAGEPGAFKPGWQYEIVAVSVRVPRG
ncbi:MAG: DUF4920 domain-containing protein [Pseudomonadota bacterium]